MMDLYHELKRCQPFASLSQEVLISLARTGDQLDNKLSHFFRSRKLTFSQYNLLRILDMEDRPLTCGEIGERLIQVVPAVTALVDRLLARELVTRERSEVDRRAVFVTITDKGRKLVRPVSEELRDFDERLLKGFKQKDKKELIRLLQLIRECMSAADV